ncbi:hypothetical protein N7462_002655 [Penicillium macrosclerotiorum]|uniref:uncharacterized protein n=1 Tax=Penicillium macrosclerotiorum TaxID=303699 RepID=UPI002549331C|nr:uncharacterized protein N7462_002655 [Penicillium macrosclerotiorum]KAJ5693232.1 hypothetical protein N7462_002655 [Penicillium macrosclerotiorum]
MVRHPSQEYIHSPYQTHQTHRTARSTVSSGLHQSFSPATQSVSVAVRNPVTANHAVSEASEGDSVDEGGVRPLHNVSGVVVERDLYRMSMPVGTTRAAKEGSLGSTTLDSRGLKRVHDLDAENYGDMPRKHGKRLTTKEEVSLFEICNRHADSFGKRSDICNWWKTVAAEFTHAHGRPYSWHSVRRKVEMVTKQRVKFLEDQKQRQRDQFGASLTEELMNPQWCAVLDSWIPTWQRWEEAEARRIAKRDEMMRRRSQLKPGDQWRPQQDPASVQLRLSSPSSPDDTGLDANHPLPDDGTNSVAEITPINNSAPASAAPSIPVSSFGDFPTQVSTSVKLPPGFENMFSSSRVETTTKQAIASEPVAPTSPSEPSPTNPMFNAVLETLGKLNKHLDAASGNGSSDLRASPVISALVQAASESSAQPQLLSQGRSHQLNSNNAQSINIDQIKEELRQEMKAELHRDRAALEEKLDSVQRTQEMILEMLRQQSS